MWKVSFDRLLYFLFHVVERDVEHYCIIFIFIIRREVLHSVCPLYSVDFSGPIISDNVHPTNHAQVFRRGG